MTQIEKLRRWADKVGWFVVFEGKNFEDTVQWIAFLLPSGIKIRVECTPTGKIDSIESR